MNLLNFKNPPSQPIFFYLFETKNRKWRSFDSNPPLPPEAFRGLSLVNDVTSLFHYYFQVYEDFGFSVSDGLYEKGIYVNRIRKGGPAHASGIR